MKFRIKIIGISLTVVILFVIPFVLVLKYIDTKDKKFDEIITRIDVQITKDSTLKIKELFKTSEDLVNSPIDYKRLLKRIYKTKNWEYLAVIAENAYQKYSKDDQLLSIYIQSLLLIVNPEKANNVLLNKKINNISEYLKLQVNISLGVHPSEDNIFYQALNENSITLFNKLFNITKNNKFLINTGLIYLAEGNYEKAESILSTIETNNIINNKLILLSKYYNGKFTEVKNLILKNDYYFTIEEINLLSIDLNLKQNLLKNALKQNLEFLNLYPDYSISPYINLILLSYHIDVTNIVQIINNGSKIFKDDKELLLSIADYYANNNMEKISILLLENYLRDVINDKEIEIILRQLKGSDKPENYINNIRDFVNSNEENTNASTHLSWKLFENSKFQDLEKFLQTQENKNSWILFFKALVYAGNGEEKLSIDLLQNAYLLDNKWEFLYNLGILSEYTNKNEKAIEYYQNAENTIKNYNDDFEKKSFIRTSLASLLYNMKDYKNAYRELNIALDMNPYNIKAHLLLKKLESSRK